MILIDTHCHLYSEEFKTDIADVISRAKAEGVQKFYLPAIDSDSHEAMLELEKQYPNECFAMMGLHPCHVKKYHNLELKIVEDYLAQRSFVAVGEIGLDFFWDKTYVEEQYDAFEKQMAMALKRNLPIVIHSRNAMQETINTLKPFAKKGLKGIFHCFSGSYESAKQIIDLGFLLGIGGVLTYKKSGLPEALEKIGMEHIVLETDAPYLTPVPHRGKRNESSYLSFIVEKLAEAKQLSTEEIAQITTENAEKLFK